MEPPNEAAESSHDSGALPADPKRAEILDACSRRSISDLVSLAESKGGFLSDDLRQAAWPVLLGLPPYDAHKDHTSSPSSAFEDTGAEIGSDDDWRELAAHKDEDQVQLDVNRSFIYYPPGQSDTELEQRKLELQSLINEVLRRHPYLCYFQGFHDVCQVFMLVLEPAYRAKLVARLSVLRIRDFMLPSLGPTTAQLRLLPDILAQADGPLRLHIATIEPFFALAGTLTMYAHNIETYRDIVRLFDVFLAREPVFSIYVFARIVMDRRKEILEIDEPDMLQVVLAKVPPQMDLDALIASSIELFETVPPESLPSWRRISRASVLKTARDTSSCALQSLQEGHAYFQQQVAEIRFTAMRSRIQLVFWRYRRPAKLVLMAVAVAAVAFHLRRYPSIVHYIMSCFSP